MTESPDDKVFDDYLSRDSAVSRAYREMDTADIPPAVDAAVLAQARAAVGRQQSKRRPVWARLRAPVALAASIVIGVSVLLESGVEEKAYYPTAVPTDLPTDLQVQQAPRESESRDATAAEAIEQVKEQPAAAPSAAAPVNEAKQLKVERALARRKQQERVDTAPAAGAALEPDAEQLSETTARSAVVPEPAPSAAVAGTSGERPAEADKLKKESMETEDASAPAAMYSRTRAESSRAPAPAAPPVLADRQVAQLSNAAPAPRLSPEAWLEQIRALRRDGKVLEADEQWRQFVDVYPEVEVAEKDLARPAPR